MSFWLLVLSSLTLTTQAEETVVLDAISVRGNKEGKRLDESVESIAVLKEPFLNAPSRENSIEVLNAVPNVQVNKNGESFSIRGINNTGVTGFQKDNLASILIDDVFQSDLALRAGSFDLWDTDSIEVLRGPQSTNQGVNSLAGSVLLFHRKPVFENEGMAKIGGANYGGREFGLVSNHRLFGEKTGVRLLYNREQSSGYSKNATTGNKEAGREEHDKASVDALHEFSNGGKLRAFWKYHRNETGSSYVQSVDPFRYELFEDVNQVNKVDNHQVSTQYSHPFGANSSLETTLAYSTARERNTSDADNGPSNRAGTRKEHHDDDFVSVESRFVTQTERVKNAVGVHTHFYRLTDDYDFNLLYPVGTSSTPVALDQIVKRYRTTFSIFDTIQYQFNEMHSIQAGGRLEYVKNKYGTSVSARRTQNLGASTNSSVDAYLNRVSGSYSGANSNFLFLPKLGYTWSLDDHHIGLTYTRAYRTGGVAINRSRAQAIEYEPEFTNNYELSHKWANRDLSFHTNFFYTDWRKQQVQVQLTNDFYDTQVANASRSRVYGGEFETEWKLNPVHSFSYGVGYTQTKFEEFVSGTTNYRGKQFPFAANWTSRFTYSVRPLENFTYTTLLRGVGRSYTNAENTRTAPSQLYLDLAAQYGWNDWLFEAYSNNVLNRQYLVFNGAPTSTTSPYQANLHQTNAPREIGVRVTYLW